MNPILIVISAVALLALAVMAALMRRRRVGLIVLPESPAALVRQPKYLDVTLLADVHAHVDPDDRTLREMIEQLASTEMARTFALGKYQVRMLNRTLEATRRRPDLTHVLDAATDELPEVGAIFEARGKLTILPSSRAAALVVQARDMLSPDASVDQMSVLGLSDDGMLMTRAANSVEQQRAPIAVGIDTAHGRLVTILRPEFLPDDVRDGDAVSILGVMDRPITWRDPVDVDERLTDHLSADLFDALRGRDLVEVAQHLAKASGQKFKARATVERGPGAVVKVAALW